MYQHAAGKEVPEGVAIRIGIHPDIESDLTLDDWLEEVDFWETEDALCVPSQYLADLVQRPDILTIEEAYGQSDTGLGGGLESKTVCDPAPKGRHRHRFVSPSQEFAQSLLPPRLDDWIGLR